MAKKKTNRAYSISNIVNKKFDPLEFENEFFDSLGKPDKAFSAIIWGNSSNGKTSFAMQLAKYLTKFGKVAYNSLEEGLSHTVQMTIERTFMEACEHSFVLLDREPFDVMVERMKKPKSPQFLIIDSVQYTRINKNQYYELKELMQERGKGIIWVSQARGKEPKGALADDIRYDVDLKLWIEGYKMFPSGRLNGGGAPFTIWPTAAAKYWKEII